MIPTTKAKEWLFYPKASLLGHCWVPKSRNPISEWLEKQLQECTEETLSFFQRQDTASKLNFEELSKLLSELQESGFVLEQISKHYKEHPPSKMSLKDLHERRESLRHDILIIDRIEANLASLSYHSHLLLSHDEENNLRDRISENTKKCELSNTPSSKDINSWANLIRLLSEIKFTETTIQLTSRLNLSYQSRIQCISDEYNHGKDGIEASVQAISAQLNELRKFIEKDDLIKLNWQSVPEFVKKSFQPKLTSEILENFSLLETKFRNLYGCLPSAKEFESPQVKLVEFQEEQKRTLTALKEKWRGLTPIPLEANLSEFFLYGLRHFELIWHKRLLAENQVLRRDYCMKMEALRTLLAQFSETMRSSKDEEIILFAQNLIQKKSLKIKKLRCLEERLIKSQSNSEIRSELARLKEKALLRWKSSFESRDLVPLEHCESNYGRITDLGKRLHALCYLGENTDEKADLWTPLSLNNWNLSNINLSHMEKLVRVDAGMRAFPDKNFRAD